MRWMRDAGDEVFRFDERPSDFAGAYLDRLKRAIDALPLDTLEAIVERLAVAHESRRQVFIAGNGGSATTASHMMNDLCKGTLGHAGDGPWPRFRAISLADNVSVMTAWANDCGYDCIFAEQLRNQAEPGDVLIAISPSGNSPNMIEAARTARALGVTVIGLGGSGGGELARLADISLVVDSHEYGPVEDLHLVINHIVATFFYERLHEAHTTGALHGG